MSETPQSHYQYGGWTVTRLKDELRNRNLSPQGKKPDLIARLEKSEPGALTPTRARTHDNRSPEVVHAASPRGEMVVDQLTVSQLKEELKQLGMSPVGKKAELVQRLQEAQTSANPFMEASRSPAAAAKGSSHTPTKASAKAMEASKASSRAPPHNISLLTRPITTIALALRCARSLLQDYANSPTRAWTLVNLLALSLLVFGVSILAGPHQEHIQPLRKWLLWYGRWVFLGILSSIGLGTGAHTFLLFLGPYIAQVTTAAHVCETLEFPVTGGHAMLCPAGAYHKTAITLPMILNKVKWEAFAWGLGTAIGELPPYLIAPAVAGRSAGERGKIQKLSNKGRLSFAESLQLASYSIVSHLGFFGILLLASIPNPLFDLAGIMSGLFMVPFPTFASALFLGKAIIKAGIQTAFVIFLFSRDYLEIAMSLVRKHLPSYSSSFYEWILTQRTVFQERRPHPLVPSSSSILLYYVAQMETIGTAWHVLLILMMSYFMISVIKSAAVMQARREGMISA